MTVTNGQRSLPRNSSDCVILDSWVFDDFISLDELFAKASGNLILSVPMISDDNFRITPVTGNLITQVLHCYTPSFYTDIK